MIPGYHDHERLAQTHSQDLLREAEHERLLAQLPQPDRNVLVGTYTVLEEGESSCNHFVLFNGSLPSAASSCF